MTQAIYLDHAATTPVRQEVRTAMEPYLSSDFGNPSSSHRWGRTAAAALEAARAEIAAALGARPSEVRFVRGGTESDNLAVLGTCRALAAGGEPPTVVVSAIEHSAVLEVAAHAAAEGLASSVVSVPVSPTGELDMDILRHGTQPGGSLVSVMWVNNETGLVLPVPSVTAEALSDGAIMHTDASQALGKIPVDVGSVPVDLLTATGHKINGPKGSGILFVRDGTRVAPMLHGGRQERALRPGTEDVAGAVGLATAIRLAVEEREVGAARLGALRAELERALVASVPGVRVNCGDAPRAPHVASIGIAGLLDGEALLMALDLEGLAVSGGSACHSGSQKGSHVISALYGEDDAYATVRFSFGHGTDHDDVERAVAITMAVVERLRAA